jgi:Mg2+ and Co2+ transporter CorA
VPYLRDVYDHVVTMLQQLELASELLGSLQNTYLSNVSIDVSEASNNVNELMKQLSGVATIIMPLSLITGLMGMNIRYVIWKSPQCTNSSIDRSGD